MTGVGTALLGMRLALGGGRIALVRLALVAGGVGLGVALLLAGLAVAHALEAREARERAREPVHALAGTPPADHLLWSTRVDRFRGREFRRVEIAAVGDAPPLPPGLARLPQPGEIVASPALARLLRGDDGALLRPRLRGRVIGTVAKAGLRSPGELIAYVGVQRSEATRERYFNPVTGFGRTENEQVALAVRLLVLVAVLGLLLPTLALVTASTRVAAATRERRLAAIRLVGATPGQARALASVESGVAAVVGCAVGLGLFFAVRPIAAAGALAGDEWFLSDLRPPLLHLAATLAGVPLLAVAAGLLALRRVELTPLGVVRHGRVRRVRGLRMLPLALGLALLAGAWLQRGDLIRNEALATAWAGSAFALVLVGLALAPAWLATLAARVVARRTRSVAALLAARRLAFEPTASGRLVSGAVLAVFTATVAHAFLPPLLAAASDDSRALVAAVRPGTVLVGGGGDARRLEAALRGVDGVRGVATLAALGDLADARRGGLTGVWVGDCAKLNRVVRHRLPSCDRTRAYLLLPSGGAATPPLEPGAEVPVTVVGDRGDEKVVEIRLPRTLTATEALAPLVGLEPDSSLRYLLLRRAQLPDRVYAPVQSAFVATDGSADTVERVRNALAVAGLHAEVETGRERVGDETHEIREIVRLIDLGTLLALAIAATGLVVASIDAVSQNRRPLAVLAAAGAPRSLLRRAVLMQAGIPLAAGLVAAAPSALAAALVFLSLQDEPLTLPLRALAALSGIALLAVLIVTTLTLPALSRAIRPEALRAE